MKTRHVQAVMTPFPYSIEAEASLREARQMMAEHEVRHLPVTRAGALVGVLSDRDMKRALDPALGMPPRDELFVDDVMVRDPYVVETTALLSEVLMRMADDQLGSALVVKDRKLVGIFTVTDACRAFAEHLEAEAAEPPPSVA